MASTNPAPLMNAQAEDDQSKFNSGFYNPFNPFSDWKMPMTISQCDLDNEIHPIFAKERFDEEINYAAITPALRLATRLITTTPVEIHEEADSRESEGSDAGTGPEVDKSSDQDEFDVNITMCREKGNLTPDEIALTRQVLESLAPAVEFGAGKERGADACMKIADDYERIVTVSTQHQSDWKWLSTRVEIERRRYEILLDTYHACPGIAEGKFPFQFIELSYNLATTLVHELSHVAHAVRFGDRDVYFEDQFVCENGFDWEAVVFGGNMNKGWGRFGGMEQWPHAVSKDLKGMMIRKGAEEQKGMVWREIRQDYFPKFLQTAF